MTSRGGGGRDVLGGLHLAWLGVAELPAGEGWLSDAEREILGGLTVEKRRADWLLGRWSARLAVRSLLGHGAPYLEILASPEGRPQVHFGAEAAERPPLSVSISHAGGVGFAVAGKGSAHLGCDVEVIEARSDGFVVDYFTEGERHAVYAVHDDDKALMANLIWSAKESALKVMGEGLRLDTRGVTVDTGDLLLNGASWSPLVVTGAPGRIFRGHWRVRDGLVWTVLTEATG